MDNKLFVFRPPPTQEETSYRTCTNTVAAFKGGYLKDNIGHDMTKEWRDGKGTDGRGATDK